MHAETILDPPPTAAYSPLRSYLLEARYEILRVLRTPSFVLPSLLFPTLFYLLFGVVLNRGNAEAARALFATYGVFGVMGTGLFAFGVSVAIERERGLLAYKRALPMPPGAYLFAKVAAALAFAAAIATLLAVLAATLGHVALAPWRWLAVVAVDVIGVLPFCAFGLLIGLNIGAQGAPAVVNLLYLPMSLLSGLWFPLAMLPPVFAQLAPVWPSYHLARIALQAAGAHDGAAAPASAAGLAAHVGFLLAFAAVCWLFARRRLARA